MARHWWRSPRSGRRRVAQGESASPGSRRHESLLGARVAGDSRPLPQVPTIASNMLSPARYTGLLARRFVMAKPSPRARGLALGYMPSPTTRGCQPSRHNECASRPVFHPDLRSLTCKHPPSRDSLVTSPTFNCTRSNILVAQDLLLVATIVILTRGQRLPPGRIA
jgi:hypothetical protein